MAEYGGKQRKQLSKVIGDSESKDVQLKRFIDNRPQAISQMNLIRSIQKKPNNTGLPDSLKSGVENLSGYSMDDIKVHYNSDKPAQLNALAYTQGTYIHVAPGQEKHLPHEAWHVVQQKQDCVQPTMQLQGVNINNNKGLEHEADMMGGKAVQRKVKQLVRGELARPDESVEYRKWDTYNTLGNPQVLHDQNHNGNGAQLTIHKVPSGWTGHYKVALEWYDGIEKRGKDKVSHLIIPNHQNYNVCTDTDIPSQVETYNYDSGQYHQAELYKSQRLNEQEREVKSNAMDTQAEQQYIYNLYTMPWSRRQTFNCFTWANNLYNGVYG